MTEKHEEYPEPNFGDTPFESAYLPDPIEIIKELSAFDKDSISSEGPKESFGDNSFRRGYENLLQQNMPNRAKVNNSVPRIFISHSHADNSFCSRLVQDLRARLKDESAVWCDFTQGGLRAGDIWWDKIVDELSNRNVYIVVLSPEAVKSRWVLKELDIALIRDMRIIPLLYKKCDKREDLKMFHRISFLPPKEYRVAFNELLATLDIPLDESNHIMQDSRLLFAHQMTPIIKKALYKKQWYSVLRKVNYLVERVPGFITAEVYHMQALALAEIGYKLLALEILDTALALVSDDTVYLTLLEDYANILTSLRRWVDLERIVDDALQVAPENTHWLTLREQVHVQLGPL